MKTSVFCFVSEITSSLLLSCSLRHDTGSPWRTPGTNDGTADCRRSNGFEPRLGSTASHLQECIIQHVPETRASNICHADLEILHRQRDAAAAGSESRLRSTASRLQECIIQHVPETRTSNICRADLEILDPRFGRALPSKSTGMTTK